MSREKFDNEKEIRRFLLGEMSEGERAAFEERFIAEDGELFDRIAVVEDELIEAYLRDRLAPGEKTKFERVFLATETRRRRVGLTREMLARLAAEKTPLPAENASVWNSLKNLLKTPRVAFATVLAVLLLVFGCWFWVLRNPPSPGDIARQTKPTPGAPPTPQKTESVQNPSVDSNLTAANNAPSNKAPANTNAANANKNQSPKPVVASLALFAGTVRSGGKTSELNLTKETTGARFELNLESRDYRTYRAEVVDSEGGVIYRSGKLTARGSRVSAFFPTAKLKKGDYLIKLYGFNPSGAEESAADFQFRVNR